MSDATSSFAPERGIYSLTLTTYFRDDRHRLAGHIVAALEALLSRILACPKAPLAIRKQSELVSKHLWDSLSGDTGPQSTPPIQKPH